MHSIILIEHGFTLGYKRKNIVNIYAEASPQQRGDISPRREYSSFEDLPRSSLPHHLLAASRG